MLNALPAAQTFFQRLGRRLQAADLEPGESVTRAAEWFLDNRPLVLRAVRQIREDMPPGFYRRLPSGGDGPLRVWSLARDYLESVDLEPDADSLTRFVRGREDGGGLGTAELWALPPMLRAAALQRLATALCRLLPDEESPFPRLPARPGRSEAEVVAHCVRTFRTLDEIRWNEFFERTSLVEEALRGDPAGVYSTTDFETRDRCRGTVERIAWRTGIEETTIAQRALEWARREPDASSRRAHVGYWLLDAGQREFERSFGYRARGRERLRRGLLDHPMATYSTSAVGATLLLWSIPIAWLGKLGATPLELVLGAAVTLIPASTLATGLVQWALSVLIPVRVLPKLDFEKTIPAQARTVVIVPALLGSEDEVRSLARQLEQHYLGNPQYGLEFVLLGDFLDASTEVRPEDEAIACRAADEIRELNHRHGGADRAPFHYLQRRRRWSDAQGCWMGWERKRGKVEEFNRLLRGAEDTDFDVVVGDAASLRRARFVITLDADTVLPPGLAARLAGTLAHPLNRPEVDPGTGRVTAGYTIVQPRVEVAPRAGGRSRFASILSGDATIDIYTRAVSDVYHDLFGSGVFVGKGIYDLEGFVRSLEGRVPENALLSHDLFEGIHGRVALASDLVLYEDYPSAYLASARRLHRWIRGDWQLLPWLFSRVPAAGGGTQPNRFRAIDQWKLVDNLRRSLFVPASVLLLACGWLLLPGPAVVWTGLALVAPSAQLLIGILGRLGHGLADALRPRAARQWGELGGGFHRWLLFWAFAPHEAWTAVDAIGRTLHRLLVSRRRLLEWSTAAHTTLLLETTNSARREWREMPAGVLAASGLGLAMLRFRPDALPPALPLLALWFLSPAIAHWVSREVVPPRESLDPDRLVSLRKLARKTWFFFETFTRPEEQWLPPDNFQEEPPNGVAHRTSPTNIGMMLLSTLSAHDLGYLSLPGLAERIHQTFETLARLERYRGHLLNWYDTETLEPLEPRYVSTVDSGNLAGCLLTLRQGLLEAADGTIQDPVRWCGFRDALLLFREVIAGFTRDYASVAGWAEVQVHLEEIEALIGDVDGDAQRSVDLVAEILERWPGVERSLLSTVASAGKPIPTTRLHDLRIWHERLDAQLHWMQREIELLIPWRRLIPEAPPLSGNGAFQELRRELLRVPRLGEVGEIAARIRVLVDEVASSAETAPSSGGPSGPGSWLDRVVQAASDGEKRAASLRARLQELAATAESDALSTDFGLLYDTQRDLFHIGYRVDLGRLDPNHYDLLASEARLAGFVAVAKRDSPLRHWFHLGRHVTRIGGVPTLLSWGGTMFEYLMPALLMRSSEAAFLTRSCRCAVERQIEYGREKGVPWGISESGLYQFDSEENYQYRAFGVPGLGFKLGLADDLVVAPYASMLALATRPRAVVENLERFEELAAVGQYGLYEAVDFTAERLPAGQRSAVVRSYMAHHQGMILCALNNFLGDAPLVRRFHDHPSFRAAEMLLHEQLPSGVAPEILEEQRDETEILPPERPSLVPWTPAHRGAVPDVHVLSNGRLTCLLTDAGGGGLRWKGHELSRWTADPTRDCEGEWFYARDEDDGALWSITRNPCGASTHDARVMFHPHFAEFHRRERDLLLEMEVSVGPADDVVVRKIIVRNETARPRRLTITSYVDVTLAPFAEAMRHPAFEKLFVRTEALPDDRGCLAERRPRSPDEPAVALAQWLVPFDDHVRLSAFETDRARFLGRAGSAARPAALREGGSLSKATGFVLDPILSVQAAAEIAPLGEVSFAFVTAAADSRSDTLALMRRFAAPDAITWTFHNAGVEAVRELQETGIDPHALPRIQRLLSAILFPDARLRPRREVGSSLSEQSRLWGLGISGDHPILLLVLPDPTDTGLLTEVLKAHRFWRGRGVSVDVVVLLENVSGYDDDSSGRFAKAFAESGARPWLHRPGGIFLLRADQLPPGEARALETAARVVLSAGRGDLGRQVSDALAVPLEIPRFVPSTSSREIGEPTEALPREKELLFPNEFGGFAEGGREYVVRIEGDRLPPNPWVNVLANPRFGCIAGDAALGATWGENSAARRLTPWRNDPVLDTPAEAVYVRDEETGLVWSATPWPCAGVGPYEVRHGAGSTEYRHHGHGLRQSLRVFVDPEDPVKIARLRIRNDWQRARRITVTYYAEWTLGDARGRTLAHIVPGVDDETGALLARCDWDAEFRGRVAFLAATVPPHGFTTDRREFLGRDGDLARPKALERWGLAGAGGAGGDPCAALQVHLDLEVGDEQEVSFVLGDGDDLAAVRRLVARYGDARKIVRSHARCRRFWERILGTVTVRTPEPSMDLLLNRWLPYQVIASRLFARTGLYQSSGAFGYRDQLQDVLALLPTDPDRARAHILDAASRQFEAGDVLHWWHPPGGKGVRTRCSDDLLWLSYCTARYVAATGDETILAEEIPFLLGEPLGDQEAERYGHFESTSAGSTLFEHCRRALERGWTSGRRGLPLIGHSDWNDGMNRVGHRGRGESVWLGWFLGATASGFAELCRRRGDLDEAERWTRRVDELRIVLEREGWGGAWYRRAFDDDGNELGAPSSPSARIDSIAQSWAAISGLGDPQRVRSALHAVDEQLVDREGRVVRLLWPPFGDRGPDPGYIRAYPPGVRENGGQYTHAAAWVGWAWSALGEGARAEEIFRLLNPVLLTATPSRVGRYRLEPYVLAGDVYGMEPHVGRGGWSWYTGAAAWTWRLGVEAILGLRLVDGKLVVEPCIPPHWEGFEATIRTDRGSCEVRVENPSGTAVAVTERILDGRPAPAGGIALGELAGEHRLTVRLGTVPAGVEP